MDLRQESLGFRNRLNQFTINYLKQAYDEVSDELNKKHKPETQRTVFEDLFYRLLRCNTKLRIYRSFWIGRRNIDLFIPAIISESDESQSRMKGLAIEIDGPVHFEEKKMKRDTSKFMMLDELCIASVVIQNHSFDHPTVSNLIRDVSKYRNPDFRSKQRMLRNVYLRTILANKELCVTRNLAQSKILLKGLGEL